MKLNLSNKDFCIYLITQFPFAVDDEKEMMLSDYMMENFNMPSEEWCKELSGHTDENGLEEDPWYGYTYVHEINDQVTLFAEFHAYNTVYFFNDIYLGNTGGHFHLSLFSWTELKEIIANDKSESSPLFLLLLPLTIGNESEREEIESRILDCLKQTALELNEDQLDQMTRLMSRHLIFQDREKNILIHQEHLGLVTCRNHSERNLKQVDEDLIKINEIISLATGPVHGSSWFAMR